MRSRLYRNERNARDIGGTWRRRAAMIVQRPARGNQQTPQPPTPPPSCDWLGTPGPHQRSSHLRAPATQQHTSSLRHRPPSRLPPPPPPPPAPAQQQQQRAVITSRARASPNPGTSDSRAFKRKSRRCNAPQRVLVCENGKLNGAKRTRHLALSLQLLLKYVQPRSTSNTCV